MRNAIPTRVAVFFLTLGTSLSSLAQTDAVIDPLDRPAFLTRQAQHSVLLAVARADRRLVAVGERGVVVLSDDNGKSWHQSRSVPVAVTLTAVTFVSAKEGWAVGHSGVVLHTADGGDSWTRQLDGREAAQMAAEALQEQHRALNDDHPNAMRLMRQAEQFAADGADKPFLDLLFHPDGQGFVVGGYGLIFHTPDGGKTWAPWMEHVDNRKGLHLNAIRKVDQAIYIAGERGLVLCSNDGGRHFSTIKTPYDGSYFTVAPAPGGGVILGGLRGNSYLSRDQGNTWRKLNLPSPVTVLATLLREDGSLLLLNQAGQVFASRDGATAIPLPLPPQSPLTAIAETADQQLVAAGFRGAVLLPSASVAQAGK